MSTVLIVDDNQTARETLLAMLEGGHYQLEFAKDGAQALKMLDGIPVDLILLDVMMPGMDGYEVCRRVRSTPKLAEVPIVLLTALDDHNSLLEGIKAGADDFLSKPVDRQELSARVRTITRLNRYHTLMEQRENLRQMAERVITAQEEERQHISRELHDDLGQALTTHMLSLRNLQNDLTDPTEAIFEQVQALYDQTFEILGKIRSLAHDLRPPVLDTLGLKDSMQTYCAEFSRRTQLPVTFEVDEGFPILPDIYNITLYRVLQEALTNIVKHAEATQVWADLTVEDKAISLTIQDNGHGFEVGKVQFKGIGLTGLHERMTLAGGKFNVSSSRVRGTIVLAQFPAPEYQKEQDAA
ncbi:MAG TPA: response regulator [Anaerolineales bacterium]|nr:response regulator [Anaerolineales bacterium]